MAAFYPACCLNIPLIIILLYCYDKALRYEIAILCQVWSEYHLISMTQSVFKLLSSNDSN